MTMEDQELEVAFLTLKVDPSANEEPGLTEAEAASDGGFVCIEGWDESLGSQVGSEWRFRQTRCQP